MQQALMPIATLLEQKAQEGSKIYQVIKVVLLASMSGYAPQVASLYTGMDLTKNF